jgi:hypothetical protein
LSDEKTPALTNPPKGTVGRLKERRGAQGTEVTLVVFKQHGQGCVTVWEENSSQEMVDE